MNDMPFITAPLRANPLVVEEAALARAEQLILEASTVAEWRQAQKRRTAAKHALMAAEARR